MIPRHSCYWAALRGRFCVTTLLRHCLLGLLLALPAPSASAAASLQALAESRSWLALLHFPRQGGSSYVDDNDFFLHPEGDKNALRELRATVAAMEKDTTVICRYPDRYQWLVQRGRLAPGGLARCEAYQRWRAQLDIQQVVLVFASSYLNSPSSMYGHTFLRLDPAGERGETAFLSYALNFGASIPAAENGMLYAYRGLFGGYPGLFSMQPYYEKIQEYTRLENRAMWEYQLNLDEREIDRMLAHTWALRDINFDYYFFDENCSYRLLELLEVARPGIDLTSPFAHAAMPVDTVRQVVAAEMVAELVFRPSRHEELSALLDQLDPEGLTLVSALAEQPALLGSAEFKQLSGADQARVTEAAYRYLRYRKNRQQRSHQEASNSLALLRAVGAMAEVDAAPQRPLRPDWGHRTGMLGVTTGVSEQRQFADFNWRISYHDALDAVGGYPQGASLAMGDLRLRWQDGRGLRLHSFTPVAIRSLAPRNDFFSPLSWQVSGGVERLDDAPGEPMVAQINGGAGGTWRRWQGLSYALVSARLEYNDEANQHWRLAPGLRIGQLWQGDQLAVEVSGEYFEFWGDGERLGATLAANWQWSRNQALRASVAYRDRPWGSSSEVALSWRWYL